MKKGDGGEKGGDVGDEDIGWGGEMGILGDWFFLNE